MIGLKELRSVWVTFLAHLSAQSCLFLLFLFLLVVGRGCCWLATCLTSQQQASVSHGRICSDKFTCCHTEIEAADQTFYLTQSQYTDTGAISSSTDPITPGAWQVGGEGWVECFPMSALCRNCPACISDYLWTVMVWHFKINTVAVMKYT